MAAYLLADVEILDPEPYREYQQRALATFEPFGGRYLVRGGRLEALEGDWAPRRLVIIEFPSFEQAKAWYESPAYQEILPIRERYARTNFLTLVEGL